MPGNHDRWAVRDGELPEPSLTILQERPARVKLTLEGERGTFGVLELPSLQLSVRCVGDGAEAELTRRRF